MMILASIALVCAVAAVGCGGPKIKGLVPAHGVVTHNGTPVEGATVTFVPKTIGGQAGTSTATTDKNGNFKMTTLDPGDGLFPGEYRISVVKDKIEGGIPLEEAAERNANPDKFKDDPAPETTVVHELPVIYGDFNTSGLAVTVPEKGDKAIKIELEGEVDLTPQSLQAGHGGGR